MSEPEQLERTIEEAQRFIDAAKAARLDVKHDIRPSKWRAAARRASMDLTRALAEFRKRGRGMKWTEDEARWFFEPSPKWAGRRSANWEPAQAIIAILDQERVQATKLARVAEAAREVAEGLRTTWNGTVCRDLDERVLRLDNALAALETPDE